MTHISTAIAKEERGLGISLLVVALTVGSALLHLFNVLPLLGEAGMPPWRSVILAALGHR